MATATVDADACESGNHVWLLAETDYSWYGGHDYFSVPSCDYVPYAHQHFYVTGMIVEYYECLYCNAEKTETTTYRDYELGRFVQCIIPGGNRI